MLSLLHDTGMRRGELASMTVAGADLARGATLVAGKTGTRRVPFGAAAIRALDGYLLACRRHPRADLPAGHHAPSDPAGERPLRSSWEADGGPRIDGWRGP